MKNKRIFAASSPTALHIIRTLHGIFCALNSGVYCIYDLKYRLLPFSGSRDKCSQLSMYYVVGASKGDSLSCIYTPILISQCQRQQVSGTLRTTVTVFLRQQRDSLHRIHHSHSKECLRTATRSTSPPPSPCISSSLVPNGSASSTSATVGSSSPSKPPD